MASLLKMLTPFSRRSVTTLEGNEEDSDKCVAKPVISEKHDDPTAPVLVDSDPRHHENANEKAEVSSTGEGSTSKETATMKSDKLENSEKQDAVNASNSEHASDNDIQRSEDGDDELAPPPVNNGPVTNYESWFRWLNASICLLSALPGPKEQLKSRVIQALMANLGSICGPMYGPLLATLFVALTAVVINTSLIFSTLKQLKITATNDPNARPLITAIDGIVRRIIRARLQRTES